MDNKNLVLAVVLSLLVTLGWFKYLEKKYPNRQAPPETTAALPGGGPAAPAGAPPVTHDRPSSIGPVKTEPEKETAGLSGALKTRIEDLEIQFQPLGASIVSYRYPGPLGDVELIEDPHPGFFATWPDLDFEWISGDRRSPTFEATHPTGVKIRKQYAFTELGGIHKLKFAFTNPGDKTATLEGWSLDMGPGMGTVDSEQAENATVWRSIAFHRPEGEDEDKFEEFDLEDSPVRSAAPWRWAGVHNRYFLAAVFAPEDPLGVLVYGTRKGQRRGRGLLGGEKIEDVQAPWLGIAASAVVVPPGATVQVEIPFYFGPKGYTRLEKLGLGLENAVSFGWFKDIGRLTLRVLGFFHGFTNNWGWSILLLTICLQVILFPLTYKQYKSMAVMKKVQPEVQKIQQKWKKDPQRMQTEMMAVYKKHGANPLGGCLPLIFQMPIFIALFNMLRGAWELHGAPWMLWVQDLSAKDPYYVLPLVMGGTMFLQNKLNPQPGGDPTQQKMMTYMPVIMTFMFLNFPAGLVLYWLTNSLLGFATQTLIKRRMEA
jgi:YidC/Oxa1 family membrane protein insertase